MPSPWKRFSWKSAMGMSCWVARPASKRTDPRAAPAARGFFTRSDGLGKTRHWPQSHAEKLATNYTNYTKTGGRFAQLLHYAHQTTSAASVIEENSSNS